MLILVNGMYGLGDNIFQRPFVRHLVERGDDVVLKTCWPELYDDLPNVRFIESGTTLRTQRHHENTQDGSRWLRGIIRPQCTIEVSYGSAQLESANGSIWATMCQNFGVTPDPRSMDLPPAFLGPINEKRAVIRPCTVRREWTNTARNCAPGLVTQAAHLAQRSGYETLGVAWIKDAEEWLQQGDSLPLVDVAAWGGQLSTLEVIRAVATAGVVIGPVGFIVPLCMAARRPLFCILGGQGMHNGPQKIVPPATWPGLYFAKPPAFCMCTNATHDCPKQIPDLAQQWENFIESVRVSPVGRVGTAPGVVA